MEVEAAEVQQGTAAILRQDGWRNESHLESRSNNSSSPSTKGPHHGLARRGGEDTEKGRMARYLNIGFLL